MDSDSGEEIEEECLLRSSARDEGLVSSTAGGDEAIKTDPVLPTECEVDSTSEVGFQLQKAVISSVARHMYVSHFMSRWGDR
jgi:hypothetical protein